MEKLKLAPILARKLGDVGLGSGQPSSSGGSSRTAGQVGLLEFEDLLGTWPVETLFAWVFETLLCTCANLHGRGAPRLEGPSTHRWVAALAAEAVLHH
jgi:hypothetical protein